MQRDRRTDAPQCYPPDSAPPGVCPCAPGLTCSPPEYVCTGTAAKSTACVVDPDSCGMGYTCQVMSNADEPNKCLSYPRQLGQQCNASPENCEEPLTCVKGKCAKPKPKHG